MLALFSNTRMVCEFRIVNNDDSKFLTSFLSS